MKQTITAVFICVSICGACFLGNVFAEKKSAVYDDKPLVQLAILLDTSNSMDGLIGQAKTELWSIVNEFITAKRGGKSPELQVALYEYGNDSLSSGEGYIRLVAPLTTDLDLISEELFGLNTNGGSEYCGHVIKDAINTLQWDSSDKTLKVIFIAGNEPFTQGDVDYKWSCKNSIAKGIIVNTIHCGSYDEGVSGKWQDGAKLADGQYLNINQNREVIHIDAPQDKRLIELNTKLNATYIAYGAGGTKLKERQEAQDLNAAALSPEAIVQRSVAKSSKNYTNKKWDLVDAEKDESFDIGNVKEEELPDEMKGMNDKEKKAYIEKKAREREAIQKEIQKLNAERQKFVAVEMKKLEQRGNNTLGAAISKAIRKQAEAKGFSF